MMTHTDPSHEFALFYAALAKRMLQRDMVFTIDDPGLVHRIVHVVRLQPQDTVVLFDHKRHAQCTIRSITKKVVECQVLAVAGNTVYSPEVTVLLPLLKREALEQALYACVELAATQVQLVTTQKIHKQWQGQKDFDRAYAIMIAAAEQSKNFAVPILHSPISLQESVQRYTKHEKKVVFAVDGKPLLELLQQINNATVHSVALIMGPEGDFTAQEYALLKENGFESVCLTPTVLRSFQALVVGLGVIRSAI